MADEWKELFSEKKQKPYWKNTVTNESTWNNPRATSGEAKIESAVSGTSAATSSEWTESFNEKLQMKVWKNAITGKSTTKNPFASKGASTAAPASATASALGDWEEKFSKEKNKKYWKNKVTGKSTWEQPADVSPVDGLTAAAAADNSEWEEKFSKEKNKKYWKNKTTGKSTFTDPFASSKNATGDAAAVAPDEWEEKFSKEKNKKYWKNKTTGKSTFTDPHKAVKSAGDDASVVSALTVGTTAPASDWEEKFSKEKNKKFWKNKVTGKSTWTEPPELAGKPAAAAGTSSAASSDWEEKFSKEKNKKYWKNKVTGKSTWTEPTDLAGTSGATAASAAPASAPNDWEEKFSKEKNKKYWKNKATGKSTWTDPSTENKAASDGASVVTTVTVATAAHASEWEEKFSKEKNKKYWKNKVTGKSSWTPPPVAATTEAGAGVGAGATAVESEWEEKFSKEKNKKYWKHKVTGKSTWTQPALSTSPTSISATSATSSRAASAVQPSVLRGVVSFAAHSAFEESQLVVPSRSDLTRRLVQLRGKLASTELDILQFAEDFAHSRRVGANASAMTETSTNVLHTFKLAGLKSLICNECAGQISIVLPAGARAEEVPALLPVVPAERSLSAVLLDGSSPAAGVVSGTESVAPAVTSEIPAPALGIETKPLECFHLLLSFQNATVAQRWYKALLLRLELAESSSTENSGSVVADRTNTNVMLSDASQEELLGSYNFASSSDAVQLRMEAEWLLQSGAHFSGAQDLQAALAESNTMAVSALPLAALPLNGLLLFKVLAVHEALEESAGATGNAGLLSTMDSSASQMKGWMSCWVRVDRAAKAIVFYDQGPGSAPSLAVNCEAATLHIPDLTDAELGCECNLYHCDVLNSPVKAKISLAIKLPNAEELFKWSVTFASMLENVTYCSGGVVNAATQAIDYLQDAHLLPLPPVPSAVPATDFPSAKPFIAEICLGVLEGLAERRMCSSYLRNVRLSGAQIKSARFLQMNQRIVLLMKGSCHSLTEGSVLLSVNGLSTVSTPASTILKFIADFPRQMLGELTLWKFPRMEFRVDVAMLAASSASNDTPKKTANGVRVTEKLFESLSMAGEEAKMTPKSKLNKVLIQKRNSILKINNGQEMSFEGIAYPNILASVQSDLLSGDNVAELSLPDTSTVEAAIGDNNVSVTDKVPVAPQMSLAEFTRCSSASEIQWQSTRFMVASGNISMLVTGDCGADILLCRLQLSSCQIKLVYPAYGSSVDHLCIHLRDARTQVVVRCSTVAVFIDLAECLLIALKMMGSFSVDLAHLYDQSVNWKTTEKRVTAGGAKPARQSLLMQSVIESTAEGASRSALVTSLLSPVRTPMTPQNTLRPSADDESEPAAEATVAPDTSILQAAEELEHTLSSLHLPLHFPTHAVLEKELVELFKLNNANHRLLAEFLTLQFEVTNPIPETPETRETIRKKSMAYVSPMVDDDKPAPAETKYPVMHSPTPPRDYEAERAVEDNADSAPAKDLDTVLRDKLMTSLLASSEVKKESDQEDPQSEGARTNADETPNSAVAEEGGEGGAEFTVVPRVVSPPSPKETVTTVRRASIQMRSGSVLMGTSGPQMAQPTASSTNRRATFRKSAITHSQEQAAVLLMSQIEKKFLLQSVLNKGDRAAISVLLNYLRNSPQDLVNIAVRFTSPTDVAGLAHFVVHRLCVYWSAEQRVLEETVFTAAQAEAPQHGRSFHDALQSNNSHSGASSAAPKTGLLFSSQSLLKRLSSTTHASGGSFLQALLNEITSRLDVVVFIQSLCEGISVESLTQDSGVADLCARVVEPFCRRFEAAVVSGSMPIVLKHTLKALVRCEGSPIKSLDFIADSILPHILNTIVAKNKFAESLNRPTLTDDQVQVILDRVRDLVNLCFNQDVARHLKICLSDQAALSRSKWYIEKSLQYIDEDSRAVLGNKETKPSSIAKLAQIEMTSGKTSTMHGMVCVRPSELFFILQSMELSNISAAPLSAYSKELSQAITHMHTSDLLQRLHSELRLTHVPTTASSHASSTQNTQHRTGILDAMRESGVPALDRELTFLLHISPHSVYHTEFMAHFNDDSAATQVLPKGLPGLPNSSNSSNSNLAAEADLLAPLLTTAAESIEESPEAHELASIRWLVQASRSALKAMYEHNNSSLSKNQSVVRELQELRGKLLSRSEEIANILADWKKISICMEVCSNYKAQIGLLLEKYKHHKKLSQQNNNAAVYWNASGVSSSDNDGAASTASLLDASATLASAAAQKDTEVQETLSKVVLLQLKLEGELQRIHYPSGNQNPTAGKGKSSAGGTKHYEQEGSSSNLARSASKLAMLAANSPLAARIARGDHSNSFSKSPAWNATGQNTPQQRGDEYISGAMRRAPNPLHVVMQSVFASSNPSTPNKL